MLQKKTKKPLCHVPASSDMADYLNLNCLLWIHYFFLSLLILIKLHCDFLKRGLAQLVATISPTNTTHFHYYTIYIFSSNLHKVSCLLERVLVILHNINGILGFVRDISTCKIYIYMVIIVKCIFYTVIDTCTWM